MTPCGGIPDTYNWGGADQDHAGGITPHLAWESFRIAHEGLKDVANKKDIWATDLDPDKQQSMDGYIM